MDGIPGRSAERRIRLGSTASHPLDGPARRGRSTALASGPAKPRAVRWGISPTEALTSGRRRPPPNGSVLGAAAVGSLKWYATRVPYAAEGQRHGVRVASESGFAMLLLSGLAGVGARPAPARKRPGHHYRRTCGSQSSPAGLHDVHSSPLIIARGTFPDRFRPPCGAPPGDSWRGLARCARAPG